MGFIVLVLFLTYRLLFKGQEISEILKDIRHASPGWIVSGGAAVFFFIAGESCIIFYMLKVFRQKIRFLSCLKYSFIGFFFSYITPSSSGGQPAQMYYMKKDGVKIGFSTLVMLVITIAYKAVLVLLGLVLFVVRNDTVAEYGDGLGFLLPLGAVLNVAFIGILAFVFFRPAYARRAGIKVVNALTGLVIRPENNERYVSRITRICDTYTMGATYVRENMHTVAVVFLMTVVQRLWLFSVTWIVYKAYGLSGVSFIDIVTMQVMIGVAVEMLPLPGAAGITEGCFILAFTDIFGEELIKPAMLISRGLTFYAVLIVGGIVTMIAHIMVIKSDKQINAPADKDTGGKEEITK
ncbi:MAG: flippase-like domain-containing protein [Ruminococcus sp.]|nr:flippase-like domain-containing protein [Ruminococcus sp.]